MNNGNTAVIGNQTGDEAKAKVLDFLLSIEEFDLNVRWNGGNNAGHTVWIDGKEYKFHVLPAGILHPHVTNVISRGVVVDTSFLVGEINDTEKRSGVTIENLVISDQAHLIMPYHVLRDKLEGGKIGTTGKGIGPCYEDMVGRRGIMIGDLIGVNGEIRKDDFVECVGSRLERENRILTGAYGQSPLVLGDIVEEQFLAAERLSRFVRDTQKLFKEEQKRGKRFIFEGAQGLMLDKDFGTYPFVTSSATAVDGIFRGTGVHFEFDRVIGVVKAYTTRVGKGPFPTELENDPVGEYLQEKGMEIGTTTGRTRRCGWLNLVDVTYANEINQVTELAITKLDVLSGMPSGKLEVCTSYEDGEPKYTTLDSWPEDIREIREHGELPEQAQTYLQEISDRTGKPIKLVSVYRDRDATIRCDITPRSPSKA